MSDDDMSEIDAYDMGRLQDPVEAAEEIVLLRARVRKLEALIQQLLDKKKAAG